jgi:hypothetical protein
LFEYFRFIFLKESVLKKRRTMLAQDLRNKNNPAIQSLYAWYPDAFKDESKYKFQTPKDVYVNLGSRPPLPKSNTGK